MTVQQYKGIRQHNSQTAQQFILFLKELKSHLPPYREEHKTQHLFIKLRPSLQKNILFKGNISKTQQELLALVQHFEGMMNSDHGCIINPQPNSDSAKFKSNYFQQSN